MKRFKDFKINEYLNIPNEYQDFVGFLKDNGINTELYGTGTYKTIGHLFQEIKEGETELNVENGKLVRRVQFVGARVLYKNNGSWLRLYETKQVFKDGRIRTRKNMPYSMAEKFKTGEDPKKVIIRGLDEELNIQVDTNQFTFYNRTEIENNEDYPGIISYHVGYEFLVILTDEQYKKEGYIEHQKDKDVYFNWRPINPVKESKMFCITKFGLL